MTGMDCQRHLFSLPPDLHYLNCAYMSPLSKRVEEAGIVGLRRKRDPTKIEARHFFEGMDRVRERFAALVNAPAERVAVIPSASYGLAVAARNTPVERGQNIVIARDQFPSNVYAWRRRAAEAGAEVRTVAAPATRARARAWNEALLEAIDGDTAAVALGQVHWTDGTRFVLEAIGGRAREVGAALIVDGAQSVGAMPFDVRRIRPDALVCVGYKWLMGPYSLGVAYYSERYDDGVPLEETWIGRRGSEDFRRLVDYQDPYRPGALRYDAGEGSNFTLVPMLEAALAQIQEWGVERIESYCRTLLAPVAREAAERGWYVEEDDGRAGHILGVRLPADLDLEQLKASLAAANVAASLRGDSLRISPNVYNDESDITALLDALRAGIR